MRRVPAPRWRSTPVSGGINSHPCLHPPRAAPSGVSRRRGGWLWALGLLVLGVIEVSACARPAGGAEGERRVRLTPCRLEGTSAPAQCGTYEVFEDRATRTGRKIPLHVVVVPALSAQAEADPLFVLAGGPGQAASRSGVLPVLEQIRRHRDIVLVDSRGTGDSNPLRCDALSGARSSLAARFDDRGDAEAMQRCRAGWDADVRLYTTSIAMDDLDDVRQALGYARVNLWGVSYGTRAALVYMRQHPERVRTAILDGVAPMGLYLPLYAARDGQRALDALLAQCEQDVACSAAYPALRARTEALLARLEATPAKARVAHPLTGVPEDFTLTRRAFLAEVFSLLYSPEQAALVPLMLDRATREDWAPLAALAFGGGRALEKSMSPGLFFAVVCAEDAPFFSVADAEREARGTWFGADSPRSVLEVCSRWPKATLPSGYREPVVSAVPTLLLSGELDPVTPPPWAEEAKRTLSHSLHVVVPGVGHNTVAAECARTLMSEVLSRGSVDGLSPACGANLKRPPFFTSFAGPVP
ncbi:alpha/beta hydrolase [Corallococcus sp. M34]|nr:alpha/beta hydrolase [Citreicoccus inhibens]